MLTAFALILAAALPPAMPVKLSPLSADTLEAAIQKDREDTKLWLKSKPTSYLATVNRRDFGERPALTVGREPDNDVRIDDPEIAAHHLRVTVVGDSFRVEAVDAAARFVVKTETLREVTLPPGMIGLGRFSLRLSHQRFPALIVFDPPSPG